MFCTCNRCLLAALARAGAGAGAVVLIMFLFAGIHQVSAGTSKLAPSHERRERRSSPTTADVERNSLLSAENEIMNDYYSDMPLLPIEWAAPHGDAYAFTDCRAIYFVAPRYRFDEWEENVYALKHEIAHVAAGCGRGHDAVWRRELARLTTTPTVRSVRDIQAGT